MTYFISDIHGEYKLFCALLKKINFSKSDRMIILGDIFDKGPEPIRLARVISRQENIKMIRGNHEHYFLQFAERVLNIDEYNKNIDMALTKINKYFPSEKHRMDLKLLNYLFDLPYYIEEDDFICVHASLELDSDNKILPLNEQKMDFMVSGRDFRKKRVVVNSDKTILIGHSPTFHDNGTGYFIKHKRNEKDVACNKISAYSKIRLDTGVDETRMLGCLRLEDMQEFYIKK